MDAITLHNFTIIIALSCDERYPRVADTLDMNSSTSSNDSVTSCSTSESSAARSQENLKMQQQQNVVMATECAGTVSPHPPVSDADITRSTNAAATNIEKPASVTPSMTSRGLSKDICRIEILVKKNESIN